MEWKLGTAMSSSACKSFNCPYVTLQLGLAESEGTVKQHTVEMTIPQFQVTMIMHQSWRALENSSILFPLSEFFCTVERDGHYLGNCSMTYPSLRTAYFSLGYFKPP